MLFKPKKLIGLDIGSSTIKMAEVDVSRKGATLQAFALTPTPANSVVNGDLADPGAISQSVRALADEIRTKRKMIATGLWGTSVIVKRITVPRMDEKMIGEQIRWEAEQYIPFDINDVHIEFSILKHTPQNPETMELLLVAARQENIFKYQDTVQGAGFECSVIDVGGFALANCFEKNYGSQGSRQTVAILNMGATVTNFVILDQGEVVFCRDIPVGGFTYTAEIQKGMNITADEAEAMKISASGGQPAPEEVANILQSAHESVADEIQGSLDFFLNTVPGTSIQQIYITGGCARTAGLLKFLSQHLKVPCDVLDPLARVQVNDRVFSPDYVAEIRDFAAVAIGLGLRTLGDS